MERRILFILILVVMVGAFASGNSLSHAADPIYIGLGAPMTGDQAEFGKCFRDSLELATGIINQTGGIHGQPVKLVVMDTKGEPKEAVLVAQRFSVDSRILAVVGDASSSCSMAAAPIYERAKIVQISFFAPSPPWRIRDLLLLGGWLMGSKKSELLRSIRIMTGAFQPINTL